MYKKNDPNDAPTKGPYIGYLDVTICHFLSLKIRSVFNWMQWHFGQTKRHLWCRIDALLLAKRN